MNWSDDFFMERIPLRRRNLQMAIYARFLADGNSIHCQSMKLATIQKYVQTTAQFLSLFDPRGQDPRCTEDGKLCPELTSIYKELNRWESIPDRREPFTIDMLVYIESIAKNSNPDSIQAAMADWSCIGLFTGMRLTEWAQHANRAALAKPQLDIFGEPRAFALRDIQFLDDNLHIIPLNRILTCPIHTIFRLRITWRTQKNGENGDYRQYERPSLPSDRSPIPAMVNIVRRFARLVGLHDTSTPIAIHKPHGTHTRYITSIDIERSIREAAAHVYNLDPKIHKDALSKWSSHSFRVGACVILHSQGFLTLDIQWLLRWRSLAFYAYLRNLGVNARKQNAAINRAAATPNFL